MTEEEKIEVLGHQPLTFEQIKEIEAMHLQHDWEKVRIDAAIAAMQGVMSNPSLIENIQNVAKRHDMKPEDCLIEYVIETADKLVERLKEDKTSLTWQDMKRICMIADSIGYMAEEDFYKLVLERFNEERNRNGEANNLP